MLFGVEHVVGASPSNEIIYLVAAIFGGGLITGLVSFLRLKKTGAAEREDIVARAAEKAVQSLQASLIRLEMELEQARRERDRIETQLIETVRNRLELEEKVRSLTERIIELEREVSRYKKIVSTIHPDELEKTNPPGVQ